MPRLSMLRRRLLQWLPLLILLLLACGALAALTALAAAMSGPARAEGFANRVWVAQAPEGGAKLSSSPPPPTPEGEEENSALDLSLAVHDASQKYCEHMFAVPAAEWRALAPHPVCLATHATLDHLYHLVNGTAQWDGPMSVAVFAPDIEYQLVRDYIRYLRACFPAVHERVSFHLVYPAERPARLAPRRRVRLVAPCSEHPRSVLESLLARRPADMMSSWRERLPYPQNLMRNLARSACPSAYVLCPDVDMVSTQRGLAGALAEFLATRPQRDCARCAYVLPVYEVRVGEAPPDNKTELVRLVRERKARPFHQEIFRHNQALSNLSQWEKRGQGAQLNVSHTVDRFVFFYEPVYLARRNVPQFDERFVGFGHTRNTQAYEMHLAGWKFQVLNNAFLVHWGYQTLRTRPRWRAAQAALNARRFPGFVRELAVRYDRDPLNMLTKYRRRSARVQVMLPPPPTSEQPSGAAPAANRPK